MPKTVDTALTIFAQREEFERLTAREILVRLTDFEQRTPQIVRDAVSASLAARDADEDSGFEARYRKALGRILDQMELYGLQVQRLHYPLQPAIVTLQLAGGRSGGAPQAADGFLDDLRPDRGRLLIAGEAGAGKSTLLQWAAVTAAYRRRRELSETRTDTNNLLNVFMHRLRIARSNRLSKMLPMNISEFISDVNMGFDIQAGSDISEGFSDKIRDAIERLASKQKLTVRPVTGALENIRMWAEDFDSSVKRLGSNDDWRTRLPLFLRLRDLEAGRLPESRLACFLSPLKHLGSPPEGFVERALDQGRCLILLDGVDEVDPGSRDALKQTIEDICSDYPAENYIVVTTRPEAAEEDWLKDLHFSEAIVEPFTAEQKETLIDQWYAAMSG